MNLIGLILVLIILAIVVKLLEPYMNPTITNLVYLAIVLLFIIALLSLIGYNPFPAVRFN